MTAALLRLGARFFRFRLMLSHTHDYSLAARSLRDEKTARGGSGIPDWADAVPQVTVDRVHEMQARKPLTRKWVHTKLGAFAASTHSIWGEIQ